MTPPDEAKAGLAELTTVWLDAAVRMERYGATPQATVLKECAGDLERALKVDADKLLSLTQAAAASGYSVDHLGRLVRQGQIENCGRDGKPLVRAGDLPRRAAKLEAGSGTQYDPTTDARSLRSRGRKVV